MIGSDPERSLVVRPPRLVLGPADALITLDPRFAITSWGGRAEGMFGWSAAEVLGRSVIEVLRTVYVGVERGEALRRLFQEGSFRGEVIQFKKGGAPRSVEAWTTVEREATGRTVGFQTVLRDRSGLRGGDPIVARLLEACRRLGRAHGRAGFFTTLVSEAVAICGAEGGCAAVRTPEGLRSRWTIQDGRREIHDRLWRPGEGILGRVLMERAPLMEGSSLCAPILDGRGETLAALRVERKGGRFGPSERGRLVTLANAAAVHLQDAWMKGLHLETAEPPGPLLADLLEAQEQERRRLARELHDEIGQSLTALLLGLKSLEGVRPQRERVRRIRSMRRIASGSIMDVKRLARGLRPLALDDLGLVAALHRLLADYETLHRIRARLDGSTLGEERPAPEVETALYRIVQEALTNVAVHSGARHVTIELRRLGPRVRLVIRDDGRGFDVKAAMGATSDRREGLRVMQERVALRGGAFTVESVRRRGTTLTVELPVERRGTP